MPKNVMMGDTLEALVISHDLDRQALVDWVWNCGCGFHRKRRYEDVAGWSERTANGYYADKEASLVALEELLNAPRPWEDRDAQPRPTVMKVDKDPNEGAIWLPSDLPAPPPPAPPLVEASTGKSVAASPVPPSPVPKKAPTLAHDASSQKASKRTHKP